MSINWWRVPTWLWWISFRPRRCVWCDRLFWGRWFRGHCSQQCSKDQVAGIVRGRRLGRAALERFEKEIVAAVQEEVTAVLIRQHVDALTTGGASSLFSFAPPEPGARKRKITGKGPPQGA